MMMNTIEFRAVNGVAAEVRLAAISDWSINEVAENTSDDPVLEIVIGRDGRGRPEQRFLISGAESYRVALALLLASARKHGVTPYPATVGFYFLSDGGDADE